MGPQNFKDLSTYHVYEKWIQTCPSHQLDILEVVSWEIYKSMIIGIDGSLQNLSLHKMNLFFLLVILNGSIDPDFYPAFLIFEFCKTSKICISENLNCQIQEGKKIFEPAIIDATKIITGKNNTYSSSFTWYPKCVGGMDPN